VDLPVCEVSRPSTGTHGRRDHTCQLIRILLLEHPYW